VNRTPIQEHSSAIIRGLLEESNSIRKINQKTVKGQLRELFITKLLEKFLTKQFGIGSGIIINQRGESSGQTDIIIYDNRIFTHFYQGTRDRSLSC